jgi:cytochrome c oxidase subunit 2
MTVQSEVWWWTLVGIGLVAVAFAYAIAHSRAVADDEDAVQRQAYRVRRWWFVGLVLLGVGVTVASLRPFPLVDQAIASGAPQVVKAVGHQWQWDLSQTRLTAGIPVEFDVTSGDVNHGFAIYGPDQRIVTQTQAMPGFTNRLLYTFDVPGKYQVLCLEYCGVAHHGMVTEFEVVPAAGKERS